MVDRASCIPARMDAFMAPLLPGGADNVLGEPLDERALDELASIGGAELMPLADAELGAPMPPPPPPPPPGAPPPAAASAHRRP